MFDLNQGTVQGYSVIRQHDHLSQPEGRQSEMSRTLDGVLQILIERMDIENHEEVMADFIKLAQELIRRFEQYGYLH